MQLTVNFFLAFILWYQHLQKEVRIPGDRKTYDLALPRCILYSTTVQYCRISNLLYSLEHQACLEASVAFAALAFVVQ